MFHKIYIKHCITKLSLIFFGFELLMCIITRLTWAVKEGHFVLSCLYIVF